jgi:hypothetical protein
MGLMITSSVMRSSTAGICSLECLSKQDCLGFHFVHVTGFVHCNLYKAFGSVDSKTTLAAGEEYFTVSYLVNGVL